MTRVAVSRDAGRAEVLGRAAAAIARHGFHGMSMRDLAKATGRSLASFYHLFRSKDEILFALQSHAFEQLLESAARALATIDEPIGRLQIFVLHHVRHFMRQPDVMRVLVLEASALPRTMRGEIRALKQRYFELGQGVLRDVLARGGRVDDDELERMTYSMFGMLNWIYGWYEPARHGTPQDLARTIQHLLLHGISALPRRDASWDAIGDALDALPRAPLIPTKRGLLR
jgi:AcrR family transcriptional regulator